ncbi:protein E6-like [Prosopis cineraria]|uniref:protein E6-like n=1 Tax=Prosopis cineraria TaxID=364024 RepID=UPI00240F21DD|nr:protein E6-like [Prosopis cineraria]
MALFSNFFSFLFFTVLFLSLQIHARDSQFFSKVTHANDNNINGIKETDLPSKEEPVNKQPEQEPVFVPEAHDSYGLYGHKSAGQFPPATTTTTMTTYPPYKTESEEYMMSKYPNNKYYSYYNRDAYNTNYYKDAYGNDLDNTKHTEGGYESVMSKNQMMRKKNQMFYNSNNGGYDDRYHHNNGERQGMSDTKFMEGGKYHYENNNSIEGYQNQGFEGNEDKFQP